MNPNHPWWTRTSRMRGINERSTAQRGRFRPVYITQPHSRESEEAVLGAVLINPEAYFDIAQILQAGRFLYRPQPLGLGSLYPSARTAHPHRLPDRHAGIGSRSGQLVDLGGPAYITALASQTPSSLHAEAYAGIVEQEAIRRRMLASANEHGPAGHGPRTQRG